MTHEEKAKEKWLQSAIATRAAKKYWREKLFYCADTDMRDMLLKATIQLQKLEYEEFLAYQLVNATKYRGKK
jgi:hypothetical protein